MEATQSTLKFADPNFLHGTYPFKYHLLRIGYNEVAGKIWHINSIYEGYNDNDYPSAEKEHRMHVYKFANNQQEIRNIIKQVSKDVTPHRGYYIMAKFHDYDTMPEFLD